MKLKTIGIALGLLAAALLIPSASGQDTDVQSDDIEINSGGKAYKSYLAAPTNAGTHPAIRKVESYPASRGTPRLSRELLAEQC